MNGKDGYRELVSLDPAAAKKAAHVENGGVSTSMKLKEQKAEEPKVRLIRSCFQVKTSENSYFS